LTFISTSKTLNYTKYLPLSFKYDRTSIIEKMKNTIQFKDISVFKHGELVNCEFLKIYNYLISNNLKYLPNKYHDWLINNRQFILNELNKFKLTDILEYQLMHDCGKPYCIKIENGKSHFPNHANVSANIYSKISNNNLIINCIKDDMYIHLIKANDVDDFITKPHYIILLITGLAELYANAQMFGGMDSISFKIKYKQILKRGRKILNKVNK